MSSEWEPVLRDDLVLVGRSPTRPDAWVILDIEAIDAGEGGFLLSVVKPDVERSYNIGLPTASEALKTLDTFFTGSTYSDYRFNLESLQADESPDEYIVDSGQSTTLRARRGGVEDVNSPEASSRANTVSPNNKVDTLIDGRGSSPPEELNSTNASQVGPRTTTADERTPDSDSPTSSKSLTGFMYGVGGGLGGATAAEYFKALMDSYYIMAPYLLLFKEDYDFLIGKLAEIGENVSHMGVEEDEFWGNVGMAVGGLLPALIPKSSSVSSMSGAAKQKILRPTKAILARARIEGELTRMANEVKSLGGKLSGVTIEIVLARTKFGKGKEILVAGINSSAPPFNKAQLALLEKWRVNVAPQTLKGELKKRLPHAEANIAAFLQAIRARGVRWSKALVGAPGEEPKSYVCSHCLSLIQLIGGRVEEKR